MHFVKYWFKTIYQVTHEDETELQQNESPRTSVVKGYKKLQKERYTINHIMSNHKGPLG